MIRDSGCLVGHNGIVSSWFLSLLKLIDSVGKPLFLVTTNIWPKLDYRERQNTGMHIIKVPILEPKDRKYLFSRYLEIEKVKLTSDDFKFFSDILTGYPGQVRFTVNLIRENSVYRARRNQELLSYIREFSSRRAQTLLISYETKPEFQEHMEFLTFLCEFDFVSRTLISEITGNIKVGGEIYIDIIENFIRSSLCEEFGTDGEYIRVNDPIRDYIRRNRHRINTMYNNCLHQHLNSFLQTYQSEEKDTSDLFYSLKQALIQAKDVDHRYLIPSHYLRAIKELYDQKKRYKTVIELADRVLANDYALENRIVYKIKLYLCLSLARLNHRDRFFKEINYFYASGYDNASVSSLADYHFLKGFYFRLQGNLIESEEELQKSIQKSEKVNIGPTKSMASRELVQVLISLEEYSEALTLAASNYEESPSNAFHIQAYFDCIFNTADKNHQNKKTLEQILDNLKAINSDKAREFHGQLKAKYLAIWCGQKMAALNLIDEVINQFNDSFYAKVIRFDIAAEFNDFDEMDNALKQLGNEDNYDSRMYKSSVAKANAIYQAKRGNLQNALLLIDKKLSKLSPTYKEKFKRQLISLYSSRPPM